MFFVVTTGRSGSTTLARVLSQHPLCHCSHEQHRILVKLAAERCHSQIDDKELGYYLETMFPHRVGLRLYGESNQKLSYFIPLLAGLGRQPKFIWLIRDGRNVVASMFSRGAYGTEKSAGPTKVWAKYRLQGDLCGDVSQQTWQMMSPFEKCCWYWSYTNRTIENDLNHLDKAFWMIVRLEELNDHLAGILKFLDLPYYPLKTVQANRNSETTHRSATWNDHERMAFDVLCGEIMDRWYPGWKENRTVSPMGKSSKFSELGTKFLLTTTSNMRWFVSKGLGKLTTRTSYR